MKLFTTIFFVLLMSACGVSQGEYDQLKAELEETKLQIEEARDAAQKQKERAEGAIASARIAQIRAKHMTEQCEEQLEKCK